MNQELSPAVLDALQAALNPELLPEKPWAIGDDKCDCTIQLVIDQKNPYLAEMQELRVCCLYRELEKLFPNVFRRTNAHWNANKGTWDLHPRDWDNPEVAMPVALWYRQLAKQTGKPLSQIREEYKDRLSERPQAQPNRKPVVPTKAERMKALEAEMRASGWIL